MKTTQKRLDMLHGPLAGKIFLFAMPIALSSVLQQLFNAADTSVVGQFADANALAAVGTNGEIVALPAALMVCGICVYRVLWVLLVYPRFGTLQALYIVWPTSWLLTNLLIWVGAVGVKIRENKKKLIFAEKTKNWIDLPPGGRCIIKPKLERMMQRRAAA